MKNKYFPDEDIAENDIFFMCYMIERVARKVHQPNKYVVNAMGEDGLYHEISCAQTSHCENPEKIEQEWIEKYGLQSGSFDVLKVDSELVAEPPTATQMGGVYDRLVRKTMSADETEVAALIRVYNHPICELIDKYNGSMYYEPSDWLASEYKRAS